jgi:hypothetical protein
MTVRTDVEEIQTTRTEKLLAVVLTAFLLLGLIWTYQKLDDVIRHAEPVPTETLGSAPAVVAYNDAKSALRRATVRERSALKQLEIAREAYRTALEAHRPAAALGKRYDAAQARYAAARRGLRRAARSVAVTRGPAQRAERSAEARVEAAVERQDRDIFLARLGLVVTVIVAAYLLLWRGRRRASRWFPLAGSVVAAATIFAFVFASDYLTDYFNPFDWGIAFIALLGIASTLLAYWAVERYIVRRLPQRRVRHRQCPFCGYPVGEGARCEGCGREIVAPCARCEAPRRVGTVHCATCGATS